MLLELLHLDGEGGWEPRGKERKEVEKALSSVPVIFFGERKNGVFFFFVLTGTAE